MAPLKRLSPHERQTAPFAHKLLDPTYTLKEEQVEEPEWGANNKTCIPGFLPYTFGYPFKYCFGSYHTAHKNLLYAQWSNIPKVRHSSIEEEESRYLYNAVALLQKCI